uniref:Uncharacterized protein LOC113788930 n=1 Tax=Dermatophagoides pteronyssinus TaxID=6956 RepID=A0A6P6XMR5_DERPT|nr:uncharacterized protein LOC113788930 [Dermatophagoides pteronyssinus]
MTYSKSHYHYNDEQHPLNMINVDDENFVRNVENQLANIPEFHNGPPPDNDDDDDDDHYDDDSTLLWKPNPERIDDNTIDLFVSQAFHHGIKGDRALHILYFCNYDYNFALNLIRTSLVPII